jgi:transcriptional regulator with XRE-family HTH domain
MISARLTGIRPPRRQSQTEEWLTWAMPASLPTPPAAEMISSTVMPLGWNIQQSVVKSPVGGANTQPLPLCHHPGMEKPSLAQRLKNLRVNRQLSQAEVADAVGMSRSYLGGIEQGHDAPGREYLVALANYYRVSLDWLTTGEGGEQQPPRILSDDEETLISLYRKLPTEEAAALLQLLLARTEAAPPLAMSATNAAKRGRR